MQQQGTFDADSGRLGCARAQRCGDLQRCKLRSATRSARAEQAVENYRRTKCGKSN